MANEIQDAYKNLFGRDASDADLAYWGSTGKSGSDLTSALTGAASGSDRTALVNNNYQDLFGRAADTGGSNFWTSDDSWSKYASGGLDNFLLQMGGGSRGNDETSLVNNLKSANGADWSAPFFTDSGSKSVWNSLLDSEGGVNKGQTLDIAALMKALQGGQKPPTPAPASSFGGYSDYMNPYIKDVLQNAIGDVNTSYDKATNTLGSQAFSSGAYGDARHGIESSELSKNRAKTIGDLSAQTNAQGFESAMNRANQDLDRQANIAYQNAMLQNNWANSQVSGANTANSIGLNDYTQNTNWLSMLQNLDQYDRNWTQQQNNADYQDFWGSQNWDQNQITSLLNILNAIPGQSTTIGTQSTPENSSSSQLGAALQQALGGSSGSSGGGASWMPPVFA